jgi:hypothetical protein
MALNPQQRGGMFQPDATPSENKIRVSMLDYGVEVQAIIVNVAGIDRLIAMLAETKKFFAGQGNAIGT